MKGLILISLVLLVAFAASAPTVEQDAKDMLSLLNGEAAPAAPAALAAVAAPALIQSASPIRAVAKPRAVARRARVVRKARQTRRVAKRVVASPFLIGDEKKTAMPRIAVKVSPSQKRLLKTMWATVHKLWGTDSRVVRRSAIAACRQLWRDTATDSVLSRQKKVISQFYGAMTAVFKDENRGARRAYEQWVQAHPSDKNRLMRVITRVGASMNKMARSQKLAKKALSKTVKSVLKANKKISNAARHAEVLALDAVAVAQRNNQLARLSIVAAADAAKKETVKVLTSAMKAATADAMRRMKSLNRALAKARAGRLTAERKVAQLQAALRRSKPLRKLAKKSKTIRKLLKEAKKAKKVVKKAAKKIVKKVVKKAAAPKPSGWSSPEYILLKNDKPSVKGTSITLPLIPNDDLVKHNLRVVKNKITGLPEYNEKKLAKAASLVGKAIKDSEVTAGKIHATCLTGTCETL